MAQGGFRVTGRVQGVGFRGWTRALGIRLGLSGTVRNLDDGSVAVHARGAESQLRELRARLAEGPPVAHVTAVDPLPFSNEGVQDGEFSVIH